MITYELGNALYLNITNRCTNNCKFCIRQYSPGVGDYNLILDKEPTTKEIIEALGDPTGYKEVVFCGYGEPLLRLQVVVDVAKYIKKTYPATPVRINTNGQANLIYKEDVTPYFKGIIDAVSVSLNAENAEKYNEICRPEYGEDAFYSVLEFIRKCKSHVPYVIATVVDIPEIDIDKCRKLAEELGVEFKIRRFEKKIG
ncbi:TatD family nuclease-associated radical SAM protein [Tepidanaerobacter syntrophicus]|uniref:TatD family nuclease-associated radical SAM protein n=1 Tax=Tepidanaerobacter syntrophicus TaxID=224999 RepID=UPI001BD25344|nr:TatD family nuclease-associated radical SAM protein [Tepidanaerobacter syntrophicus]